MPALKKIIVPVDGSELSNRAIPVAAALATAGGVSIEILSVATDDGEVAGANKGVSEASRLVSDGITVEQDTLISPSPVSVLLERAAGSASVLCLAAHDRRPAVAALMDSVGSQLLQHARRPLIVVGSAGDRYALGRDVVVALDGVQDAGPLLATGLTWAGLLKAPLRVVTVYEPVLPDVRRPEHFTRRHGPSTDADAYLNDVVRRVDPRPKEGIELLALPDPVSVAGGLMQHLSERPALLVVAGAPRGTPSLEPSVLRDLTRRAAVPVLVVPKAQLEPDGASLDLAECGRP